MNSEWFSNFLDLHLYPFDFLQVVFLVLGNFLNKTLLEGLVLTLVQVFLDIGFQRSRLTLVGSALLDHV